MVAVNAGVYQGMLNCSSECVSGEGMLNGSSEYWSVVGNAEW